jgi:hypothetical protein
MAEYILAVLGDGMVPFLDHKLVELIASPG